MTILNKAHWQMQVCFLCPKIRTISRNNLKNIEQVFDDKYNENCKVLCSFNALGGCNR